MIRLLFQLRYLLDGIKAWDLGCGESEVIAHALSNTVFHTIIEMAGETEGLQRLPDVDK